jgi:hypothetical protein
MNFAISKLFHMRRVSVEREAMVVIPHFSCRGFSYPACQRPRPVARLLKADTSHRYLRVSIGGEKRYVHQLVAEAWHGERPAGQVARHLDDVPEHARP